MLEYKKKTKKEIISKTHSSFLKFGIIFVFQVINSFDNVVLLTLFVFFGNTYG